MIRFRCGCNQWLEVPESEAGGAVQCTHCGRLRSVPPLDELATMEEDGTFALSDDAAGPVHANRWMAVKGHDEYVTPRPMGPKVDPETGEEITEIDLAEPWAPAAGLSPLPVAPKPAGTVPPGQPMTLAAVLGPGPNSPPPEAPADRAPVLGYSHKHENYGKFLAGQVPIPLTIRPVYWYSIPLELLQPANALVLCIVFGLHVVLQGLGLMTALGVLPFALIGLLLVLVLVAHYVAVIDETGPEGRDELPSVLRNVSFADDLWGPLWSALMAAFLCFGPSAALWRAAQVAGPGGGAAMTLLACAAVAAIGLALFPAVLLTVATSGTAWNLLPGRVLGVIGAAPGKYALALLYLLLAGGLYAVSAVLLGLVAVGLAGWSPAGPMGLFLAAVIGYPALFAAIYFAHAFGWLLGKIYQEHHEAFGWLLQRHVSTRTDEIKVLERQRAAELRAIREAEANRATAHVRARLGAFPPSETPAAPPTVLRP